MGESNGLKVDPAIEHWGYMRNTTHAYYRFNFRKLIPTLFTMIIIPGLIYYGMVREFVRTNFIYRSKAKGKSFFPKGIYNQ
jgi:hypothetical protein